jgi:hypothetical protein
MHLAHKGVHRAEIARGIGEHLDCIVADPKQATAAIGRQDRGRNEGERGTSELGSFHRPHGV